MRHLDARGQVKVKHNYLLLISQKAPGLNKGITVLQFLLHLLKAHTQTTYKHYTKNELSLDI